MVFSMVVRRDDLQLKRELDALLQKRAGEIRRAADSDYGVPLADAP